MSAACYDIDFACADDEGDFREFCEAHGVGRGAFVRSASDFVGYLASKPEEDGWKLLLARNDGRVEGFATISTVGGKPYLGQHLWAASETCGTALFDWIERDGPLAKWI